MPIGWSILHELAKLDRGTIERLIDKGDIHPGLTLAHARQLVDQFRRNFRKNPSCLTTLRQRLRRFEEFVRANLPFWSDAERDLALSTLTGLIEQISQSGGARFNRATDSPLLDAAL